MSGDPTRCETCAVRHQAICGALPSDEVAQLNSIAHHRRLPAGHIILSDNEQPDYFANIISGVVKLTKSLSDGREQIVGLQFMSDFLGRPYRPLSPYRAEAVTPVHLCTFDRHRFERLAGKYPDMEHRLLSHTLDELDAAQEWMLLLGRKSAAERVATFLHMVSKRMEKAVGCNEVSGPTRQFELPLTRAEIADFLGLTIETVSRQFTRLKVAGVLSLEANRIINIVDAHKLGEIAAE